MCKPCPRTGVSYVPGLNRSEAIHLSPCGGVDCFASLAMTLELPARRALHGRLSLGVRDPQVQACARFVGVDRELAPLEQRLHAAIAEFLRRDTAVKFGGE